MVDFCLGKENTGGIRTWPGYRWGVCLLGSNCSWFEDRLNLERPLVMEGYGSLLMMLLQSLGYGCRKGSRSRPSSCFQVVEG